MKLSIAIITFNRKTELLRAIDSCIDNRIEDMEFVIVDNHSTDGTKEEVERYFHEKKSKYQYIYMNKNLGVAGGRNKAMEMANGEYVFFLDDDAIIETEQFFDPDGNPFLDENGNPIEFPANPWYSLGYEYGYTDVYFTETSIDPNTGEEIERSDWYWVDTDGNRVADSDLEFRNTVFRDLINRYNNEQWDLLSGFGEIAPVVGFDFYHYKSKFWLHAYANYILPHHKYISGDEDFSYLNRNNWGKGGLRIDSEHEQWDDYNVGVNLGWKLSRHFGVFIEGEYGKFWDSELYQTSIGLNFSFK